MTLIELKNHIKGILGYPYVKVELHDDQLNSIIERAYKFHKKWGVGISTQETCFTLPISAGEWQYNLPAGVHSVIEVVDTSSNLGGSQELFSVQNMMYMQASNNFSTGTITGFSLIDYTLSMQYIDLVSKYAISKYNFKYHEYSNVLTVSPTPSAGNIVGDGDFILVHSFMEEGYDLNSDTQDPSWREYLYEDEWFQEYCLALSKMTLGFIRRKFANVSSMGNANISLDGDSLVSEGKDEKDAIEERLKNEMWEGLDISID